MPPSREVHTNRYDHEKLCGDVFVEIYLSGKLSKWGKKTLSSDLIPDRYFVMGGETYYLEAEMGNHGEPVLAGKVEAYKKYFHATKEPFRVLFVMYHDEDLPMIQKVLANQPKVYEAVSINQLRSINSSITSSDSEELQNAENLLIICIYRHSRVDDLIHFFVFSDFGIKPLFVRHKVKPRIGNLVCSVQVLD